MKIVNKFFGVAIVMAMILFTNACKGPAGDIGPAGATGATGAIGATGPAGASGASVTQVTFTTTYVPSNSTGGGKVLTFPTAITTSVLDNSAVLTYVRTSNFPDTWYSVPGVVSLDVFRAYIDRTPRTITILRDSGTAISSITVTRCVIIPNDISLNGRKAAIDYSDYEAVKRYYSSTWSSRSCCRPSAAAHRRGARRRENRSRALPRASPSSLG